MSLEARPNDIPKMPPAFLASIALRVYSFLSKLRDLLVPAELAILGMGVGSWVAQALYVAAKLRIADRLAAGPRTAEQLGAELGVHASSLYRVLRALSMYGIFREDAERRFSLTRLSRKLRSDVVGSARAHLEFFGDPWQMTAWSNVMHSMRTGKPAFDEVHQMPFFDYCAKHPDAAKVFDEAMVAVVQLHAGAVLGAYDFSGLRSLCDVGGGHGLFLAAILRKYASLRGVLFDLPHVVAGAETQLRAFGVETRCERQGGSFFESVPSGHDAYVMSHVLHDWDDDACVRILGSCRDAMRPDSRLLVVDALLPPGGNAFHPAKLADLQMMVTLNGKERTEAEFQALFAATGLRLARVIRTAAAEVVLEVVPAG